MPTKLKVLFEGANSDNGLRFELEQISDMMRNCSVNGLQSYDLLKPSTKRSDENIFIVECEEKVQKDRLLGTIVKLLERLQVDFRFS